jgi:hypothetical protein
VLQLNRLGSGTSERRPNSNYREKFDAPGSILRTTVESLHSALDQASVVDLTEEQREALIADLVDQAGNGRHKLRKAAAREFEVMREDYAAEFERVAADLLRERSGSALDEEVARLRAEALEVGLSDIATEDRIREVCDPALSRLLGPAVRTSPSAPCRRRRSSICGGTAPVTTG